MARNYPIFIAHTSDDEPFARYIYENLGNIVEFQPYLSQDYLSPGNDFRDRIQNAIDHSRTFIVILSKSAITNQWVNQELGYACAVKKRNRNFQIIPLSHSDINLKGFITRKSEDIIFYDEYSDERLIAELIAIIRLNIPYGSSHGTLRVRIKCEHCIDNVNLPTMYTPYLPDHETLIRAVNEGHDVWYSPCPSCEKLNWSNIFAWKQVPRKEIMKRLK